MRKPLPQKSLGQFMAELEEQNVTLADWARERKLDLNAVYMVASGRALGRRGKSREVMKAMGVTPPPMYRRVEEKAV